MLSEQEVVPAATVGSIILHKNVQFPPQTIQIFVKMCILSTKCVFCPLKCKIFSFNLKFLHTIKFYSAQRRHAIGVFFLNSFISFELSSQQSTAFKCDSGVPA